MEIFNLDRGMKIVDQGLILTFERVQDGIYFNASTHYGFVARTIPYSIFEQMSRAALNGEITTNIRLEVWHRDLGHIERKVEDKFNNISAHEYARAMNEIHKCNHYYVKEVSVG